MAFVLTSKQLCGEVFMVLSEVNYATVELIQCHYKFGGNFCTKNLNFTTNIQHHSFILDGGFNLFYAGNKHKQSKRKI